MVRYKVGWRELIIISKTRVFMEEENCKDNGQEDMAMFENKTGLCEDMKFLANMPELYDVTFLVGDSREPVGGIKAVLAARSRFFSSNF